MRYFLYPLHRIALFSSIPFCSGFSIEASYPPVGKYQWYCAGMVQDAQGYLWMATVNGLYKYDGYQYSYYLHQALNQNSPASNYIECINIDKAGNLWLGTRERALTV